MENIQPLRAAWSERRLEDAWAEYVRLAAAGEAEAEGHYLGARVAWGRGDLLGARRIMEDRALAAGPTGSMLAHVRFGLGMITLTLGESAVALELFDLFLQDLPGDLAPVWEGPAYLNRGLALRQLRRYPEAIQSYHRACVLFRAEGMKCHLSHALQNMAWAACLLRDTETAREALEESRTVCETQEDLWHQRLGEAFLAATAGEGARALDLCRTILSEPGSVPDDVRSHACWIGGRAALQLRQLHEALCLANEAVTVAVRAKGLNRCFHDASELLREVRLAMQQTGS